MHAREPRLPDDDERVPMTAAERTVWAYLVAVVVTSGGYLALMVHRVAVQPVERISWIGPMLWTIGLSVLGTVLGVVVGTVVGAVNASRSTAGGCGGAPGAGGPDGVEVATDVRDREIDRLGGRASTGVIGVGLGAVLMLAMIDAHPFWIGNAVFLSGAVGAVLETTTKIRLYRRGF